MKLKKRTLKRIGKYLVCVILTFSFLANFPLMLVGAADEFEQTITAEW